MSKETGGQAFPVYCGDSEFPNEGMTLRDYFAAKALQGELAAQVPEKWEWNTSSFDALAKRSYQLADAMLEARES